eukprot:g12882.t1
MNAIYKLADNTTVVGWISNYDESKCRSVIDGLVMYCNENNLSRNVGKTKELVIDFRKKGGEYARIYIDVERLENVKFLKVMITDILSLTSHIDATIKKAQQCLYFLRKFGMSIRSLTNFYRCTIE